MLRKVVLIIMEKLQFLFFLFKQSTEISRVRIRFDKDGQSSLTSIAVHINLLKRSFLKKKNGKKSKGNSIDKLVKICAVECLPKKYSKLSSS